MSVRIVPCGRVWFCRGGWLPPSTRLFATLLVGQRRAAPRARRRLISTPPFPADPACDQATFTKFVVRTPAPQVLHRSVPSTNYLCQIFPPSARVFCSFRNFEVLGIFEEMVFQCVFNMEHVITCVKPETSKITSKNTYSSGNLVEGTDLCSSPKRRIFIDSWDCQGENIPVALWKLTEVSAP